MLDFVFIFTSVIEIILTGLCIFQILKLEKRVIELNHTLIYYHELILEINKKVKEILSKINKVVSIIKDRRFQVARKILHFSIDTIQIILLIRSLNFSKGLKSIDFTTLKRVATAEIVKRVIRRLLFS